MTPSTTQTDLVRPLDQLTSDDTATVGGKNASLGEMIRELAERGVRVPGGFATTADAYRLFIAENELEQPIREALEKLDGSDKALRKVGGEVRKLITGGELPGPLTEAIRTAYRGLATVDEPDTPVAARSSATAEDLPEASFAGQLETFLNLRGEDAVLDAVKRCFASLFTDRGIAYRQNKGFDHMKVALSVGVQRMVHTDRGGAGVMFTLDTETGFPDVVVINANWGLGETVVGGGVTPDEYRVFKPLLDDSAYRPIIERTLGDKQKMMVLDDGGDEPTRLTDTPDDWQRRFVLTEQEVVQLARWAVIIESHYGRPMDIEWARDGESGELSILQARPETVQSQKQAQTLKSYRLREKGKVLVEGLAIGDAVAAGKAFVLDSPDQGDRFEPGGILVTEQTDPDWGPLMKRAGGIVTDHGGRTSHAAIVSRELGVPAVIGAGNATDTLSDGQSITLACTGETGVVYDGELEYEAREIDPADAPETRTELMMILASPGAAMRWWNLPARGIGLARMEFIVNNDIQAHPLALTRFDEIEDRDTREQIEALTRGFDDKPAYFVEKLSRGIAKIAAAGYPHDVIVRLSDFKTNEYADLLGGSAFEPQEANPMIGFRGAARYVSDRYRDGFALECAAIHRAREVIGLGNIVVMVPFCRTPEEADAVLRAMADHGLVRGEHGLRVYVMAEVPSNIILADAFAERFDGFSIGTNDLTQLVLGIDRDAEALAERFDEQHEAIKWSVRRLIERAHAAGKPVGICGQAPSDHPEFAEFLVGCGIDSISVNPDSVMDVLDHIAAAEAQHRPDA